MILPQPLSVYIARHIARHAQKFQVIGCPDNNGQSFLADVIICQ